MYPHRPDLVDAETVLIVHDFLRDHGRPPSAQEVANRLGITRSSAHHRLIRATMNGWLIPLAAGQHRMYVTLWYRRQNTLNNIFHLNTSA